MDLPPPVEGDPAGMRELAATLRAEADRLGALAGGVADASAGMGFEAPAADRIRDGLGESGQALLAHAAELQDLAATLAANADAVEQARRDRDQLVAQLTGGMP